MAAGDGVDALRKFELAEPWVDEQIARRLAGVGHTFPGYTYDVIGALPYEHWVGLAISYDEHVEELKKQQRKT